MSDLEQHILRCNKLIETELKNWEKIGAVPANVKIESFILDAYVNALGSFLIEKGIIDEQEFMLHFKKTLLDNLINARENIVEPAIKEQRKMQILDRMPGMDIPKQ